MIIQFNFRISFSILRILIVKGWCTMKHLFTKSQPEDMLHDGDIPAQNRYDDDDIPPVDLPKDVIPDEVPRRDGPGGEPSLS